ncbi:hypothetical protein CKM354_001240000 [Cercospora kikuchii]|uniref:Proteasome component ECM29 n=1 Tax=Cercospora kikuchii TaxID=84275 RepID=A0A9P3FLX2_9PEZI|nr:uncharacterized protein CKM354_001240000 [Cercospora kikuchii]GIZ49370.1 hypothetical protein CKM354_001240000 [Cercospora kikuchii]
MASTDEQRELSLVGKVELKIALTDTDAKLETILKTYLAPLLLKLASPHESVRKKVITICQHVNTRIQPKSIQLPVAALVKQFKEQESSLIRHFDLLYIQQGVVRLSNADKADLLPVVASGISKTGQHGSQIFYLLLRILPSIVIPARGSKEDLELRSNLSVSDEDAAYLAGHLGKLILFTPQKSAGNSTATCPGLTTEDYAFLSVNGKDEWNPSAGGLNLLQTKTMTSKLLASGLFNDSDRFLPALFASADPASSISDVGDDILKRALPATDLEDEALINTLYDLYFGKGTAPRVRAPLRIKILNFFAKSTKSTTFDSQIIKLVHDGLSTTSDGEDVVMSNGPVQNINISRETLKLRAAIFAYITFVARFGDKSTLQTVAIPIVTKLRDFVENQGWPKIGPSEDLTSRAYAYEVIGLLSKSGPKSLLIEDEHPSLDLLRWLFDSLARDASGNSIIVSIEESLSTILGGMHRFPLQTHEQQVLEELLIDQMNQSANLEASSRLRSTRYVAVRFANRCLPYSSVKGRWIDALAMGATSDRPEVREEGERGLSPYWHRMLNGTSEGIESAETKFPGFKAVVQEFFVVQTKITSDEAGVIARRSREVYESSYLGLTAFARRMLIQEALREAQIPLNLDSEWERRLDAMAESDLPARQAIKSKVSALTMSDALMIDVVLSALFECTALKSTTGEHGHLVELLSFSPNALVQKHVGRVTELQQVLKSNNHTRRMAAAHAFGILASHQNFNSTAVLNDLLDVAGSWQTAVGTSLSATHGALVSLGYYYSRASCRGRSTADLPDFGRFLTTLFGIFENARDDLLQEATFVTIGQLCMFNCLTAELVGEYSSIGKVSDKLYSKAKDGNEPAVLCLGQLSMIVPEDGDDLQKIQDSLHKLHEVRQSEVHFTVGEALTYVASGWNSTALATKLDVDVDPVPQLGQTRQHTLGKLVDRVLADCANTKPALKKAAVMWLLCLVQFCGERLQNRLAECQTAFRRCLADRDELVQETASRGLGLVYEKGDRILKDDLVRELVSSFSSDKQQLAGNVAADTQLFEPGQLPTGDGSVSTYKDIMSLASEVGDSSLVYKFMSMASSNAIWSSRAAFGRFGLSRVLSDSSVDGYLADNPKLYPKLFRYRFDPNSGVQRSMNEIWTALVPDSAATITKHFDAIMDDLLVSILGKEWRVRQACCAAVADLVQGRPLEQYESYLERIWTQCFKVLDDIKESVRAAAASLARTLTGVLTRALEADHSSTKNASAMLKHVLPFLLSPSGMESSAKETQMFSVHTLLEIIKKANGATLRLFIPELVERLIGLLSSLEPEAVNYVHMNASKYNLTEQKIDDMRLSSVRSSPLMEAIERCLDLLDEETMRQLQPKLESAMKSSVGLPSKVGSSRVLVSLATRRMLLFRPYADDTLKLLERLIIDRNDTVSSSYAAAAGYVARGASDKQILRYISFASKLYFDSEGDRASSTPRRSIASGELMLAFAKNASDKFNAFATSALPFVFVGKHDSNEQVRTPFKDTWEEAAGGSRAAQLYLKEILDLCTAHLDSPQWHLKHTAARTVAEATKTACAGESQLSAATGAALWPAIEKALSGKTWDGKEDVLSAFVKFVESAQVYYSENEVVRNAIVKIAIREAKRQNVGYRQHSIGALAKVALARTDVDLSEAVLEVATPLLSETPDEDAMEIDGADGGRKADEIKEITTAGAIEAIFASINPRASSGTELEHKASRGLHEVAAAKTATSARTLRSLFESLQSMFERVRREERKFELDATAIADLKTLLFGPSISIQAIRLARAHAVLASVTTCPTISAQLGEGIRATMAEEPSNEVRQVLESAWKGCEAL